MLANGFGLNFLILLFVTFLTNAQTLQVNILGGDVVTNGSSISIDAGNSISFRITNAELGNCKNLKVENVTATSGFDVSVSTNLPQNIKPEGCNNGTKYFDFTITRTDNVCSSEDSIITVETNQEDISFTLTVERAPIIYVLGGSPWADINNHNSPTNDTNGTYFGVVDEGSSVTRTYILANIGSCSLDINNITSSDPNFVVSSIYDITNTTPNEADLSLDSFVFITFNVTFTAPTTRPVKTTGTQSSVISIVNNDPTANPFVMNVSAEMFNFTGPGPGGITADFRLWLKSTRGIKFEPSTSDKVRCWLDVGTNGKNAEQLNTTNQPTFVDSYESNINFNPVIKFQNDGSSLNQYLLNSENGYYTQDMFMVMIPDVDVSSSPGMTIFSGTTNPIIGYSYLNTYINDINDVSGVGFGDFTSRISGEKLWYNQGNSVLDPYYTLTASTSNSYDKAGIINARNKTGTPSDGISVLYNSFDNLNSATKSSGFSSENLGYVEDQPDPTPDVVWGTPYKIGINSNATYGNLNGRVAEILTFAERVPDADRPKIESYLAIKYGITLGESTEAQKNYVNSAGTVTWDISANSGFNYNIAGIGRDDISDLNQKQSKSVNETNEVIIGLGVIAPKNSSNTNEFENNKNFLVWGCNNENFFESTLNTNNNSIELETGFSSALKRIDRKWKIVETGGDIGNVYVGIPLTAFDGFSKTVDEEYVLIVSDNANFADGDIIDVIPLKTNLDVNGNPILDKEESQVLQTWYDFDGVKYFTFGKASKLSSNKMISIQTGDYLIGEYGINLNANSFSISTWLRDVNTSVSPRTIMAKGDKLQLRLNTSNKIEVIVGGSTPVFTSNATINDQKWHHLTFVFNSGSVILYIDGVIDKSEQGIDPPSPNYNHFSIGAIYENKTVSNHLLGEIDEVYIWNLALTQDQVNKLMNQEIEKNGALVKGKTIANDFTDLPWVYLAAYYNFNSFYGTTIEGQTNNRFFLRLNYLNKTKTLVQPQTAPLPYVTRADGDWDTPGTWLNNTVQNIPNSTSLKAEANVEGNIVQISHDITSGNRDIKVLGLLIDTGKKLTIANPTVTTPIENNDGQGLRITHYLKLNGILNLVGESQLIQDEGSVIDNASTGYLDRDQQGTANSFNYNYWSSSVGPIASSGNSNYTILGVLKDGSKTEIPLSINFGSNYRYADGDLSADGVSQKLSSYWLYKFNGPSGDYNSWFRTNQISQLVPGEGYTMKGTSGKVSIATKQNYKFRGKPYNGDISLTISAGNSRLIGNPYPSAIDADEFILDNISEGEGRNSVNVFNGVLYFWHHFGDESSHILKEYVGGYATYTLMGGVEAYSTNALINNATPLIGGGKIPERNIAVNQGFFVSAVKDIDLTGDIIVSGGTIVFKNSQRVFERERVTAENSDGSVFFKGVKETTNAKTVGKTKTDLRPKIRLEFNSPKGIHRQLLVGADKRATKNFDLGFDAPIADLNKEDAFWVFNKSKFVIQAVDNFNKSQELPLGMKVEINGKVTIKIHSIENLGTNFELFIKDNSTGETYSIIENSFEMNLAAGEYLDRFSLVFQPRLKTIEEVKLIDGVFIYMNNINDVISIKKIVDTTIENVTAFNLLGQKVGYWNTTSYSNEREMELPFSSKQTGVYIVQINTSNGIINKKIICN